MGRTSRTREVLIETISEMMWQGSYGCLTIDSICQRADVRKGSFYHFFDSKSDLAIKALEVRWQERKKIMDTIFSPTRPPLSRIKTYFDEAIHIQQSLYKNHGQVLGCPDFAVGAELSASMPEIAERVQDILASSLQYLESAVRDAEALGQIEIDDAATSARLILSFYEGALTLARIHNDPQLLNDIWPGTLRLLGVSAEAD